MRLANELSSTELQLACSKRIAFPKLSKFQNEGTYIRFSLGVNFCSIKMWDGCANMWLFRSELLIKILHNANNRLVLY